MATGMQIAYLADHPRVIPVLAEWFASEWGYMHPEENTVAGYLKRLPQRAVRGKPPICLLGFRGGVPIATATLKFREIEYAPRADYWIGSVYVRDDMRGRGHGCEIVRAAEDLAARLGLCPLHLFTPSKEAFYRRMGWTAIGRTVQGGRTATVMRKDGRSTTTGSSALT